jgi:hypothetical protein
MKLELDRDTSTRKIRPKYDMMRFREYNAKKKNWQFLARYHGSKEDVNTVVKNHIMNGEDYSIIENNCQHYAAVALIELDSSTIIKGGGRKMSKKTEHYNETIGVLKRDTDGNYRNIRNLFYEIMDVVVKAVGVSMLVMRFKTAVSVLLPYTTGILGFLRCTYRATQFVLMSDPRLQAFGAILIAGSVLVNSRPQIVDQIILFVRQQSREVLCEKFSHLIGSKR